MSVNKKMTKDAGKFSTWLSDFIRAMQGEISMNVPCGECVACCTSSKFVHLRPSDKDALNVIPKGIVFPAPGLPKGYYLLGYDENGHCPMFKSGKCSIYEFRPETCRQYDCRVFTATGFGGEEESVEIARQSQKWEFCVSSREDKRKYEAVQKAAAFLVKNPGIFPAGYLPRLTSQLAVFAIRIHEEFCGISNVSFERNLDGLVRTIVSKYQHRA